MPSIDYYRRLVAAYLLGGPSHLNFWHDLPEVNPKASYHRLGPYYLTYSQKADYPGPFDEQGIPLLDYRGKIGRQYNPVAIAQYGLAQFNQFGLARDAKRRRKFLSAADWLVKGLESNSKGVHVWLHHFDWPYRQGLKKPWSSALAQGQGLSVLCRAWTESSQAVYLEAARKAYAALTLTVEQGGLTVREADGELWLEEYLVTPPSHILNGAICAAWGLFDFWVATGEESSRKLFDEAALTLRKNLHRYDTGFWSLYQIEPEAKPRMLASPYYHRLHVAQLQVMALMTGEEEFGKMSERWAGFMADPVASARAYLEKAYFKLRYY